MKKIIKKYIFQGLIFLLIANLIFTSTLIFRIDIPSFKRVWVDKEKYETLMLFEKQAELYSQIKEKYYLETEDEKLLYNSIQGMFLALGDKYSYYMTKEEFEKNYKNSRGELVGIGITIEILQDGKILVKEVRPDTPAKNAGLLPGDTILSINQVELTSENTSSVISIISSAEKKYGLWGDYKEIEISYLRESQVSKVMLAPVVIEDNEFEYEILDDVGYIKIKRFIKDTPDYFKKALEDMNNKKIDKIIIDLRDNPGGLLDSLVETAGYILGNELILTSKGNYYGEKNFISSSDQIYLGEIAVLINENSASASEAFSAAIKDYERGIVFGANSFGKGIVQNTYTLRDGSGYKLTTSEYFSPKGSSIQSIGVMPDIETKKPLEDALEYFRD